MLHIVQGGVTNGDKKWLQRAAQHGKTRTRNWIVPKSAAVGDHVVIYVDQGLFATATVRSRPNRRSDWKNRYGADVHNVTLIEPPIGINALRRRLPALGWARYPRSIATPPPKVAEMLAEFIKERRKLGRPALDDRTLQEASLSELRVVALLRSSSVSRTISTRVLRRLRAQAIRRYVLCRAGAECEGCRAPAPFITKSGQPYLEPHHITRLADDGPDHPARVIALCPNCHRRVHFAEDGRAFNEHLKRLVVRLERAR